MTTTVDMTSKERNNLPNDFCQQLCSLVFHAYTPFHSTLHPMLPCLRDKYSLYLSICFSIEILPINSLLLNKIQGLLKVINTTRCS